MRLPGLHSIHWKVFVFHLTVLLIPLTYIAFKVRHSIEISYLHSTEEGMIDTAAVIAELYARMVRDRGMDTAGLADEFRAVFANLEETYEIKARLFDFTRAEVDTRLLVYDASGHAIFDTDRASPAGEDHAAWSDVRQALRGQYGSRWEKDQARKRVNLYSTLPVFVGGKIVGAVSVSKPTNRIRNFISRSLYNLLLPVALALVLATAMAYALSAYITRIVWSLASKADRIAAGEPNIRIETWTRSELGTLAGAVEKMRRKIEGKAYVEEIATNLSHELKTPLAAIRGAAEVLETGAMDDPAARAKFLSNIQGEVQRLDRIVSELLKLSRIESQPRAAAAEANDIAPIVRDLAKAYAIRAENLGLKFSDEIEAEPVGIKIAAAQLEQLLANLLDNALQFTPAGGAVELSLARSATHAEIRVTDHGPG
ncbi:MAG: HAMP domain-containing protein, partial [Verrucomicrobiota bacterium]|nr:HAMP domain-containing protein [Verrucomicrobiota bacterium]